MTLQPLEFVDRGTGIVPVGYGLVCVVRSGERVTFGPDERYRPGEWALSNEGRSRFFFAGADVERVRAQLENLQ